VNTPEQKAAAIQHALSKKQKLRSADLQILRENAELLEGHDKKNDYYLFRMQIEFIDAVRSLDESSARLVKITNWLTFVILGLTVAGVVIAWIALRQAH